MKPRAQMAAISDDLSIEEMIEAARKYKHRRLPIYDETPDTIVGICDSRHPVVNRQLIWRQRNRVSILCPGDDESAATAQEPATSAARNGNCPGRIWWRAEIVTTEDILEEMIGKIRGETEAEVFVMGQIRGREVAHEWNVVIDDFRREYPLLGEVPEVETMGGLLMSRLEVVPNPGESVVYRGLKLTAQAADERRVRELMVEVVR